MPFCLRQRPTIRRIRKRNNSSGDVTGFCRACPEARSRWTPCRCRGLGGAELAGADPFTCAAAAPFWPSASKSPEPSHNPCDRGPQYVLIAAAKSSDRRKKPLSGRIILYRGLPMPPSEDQPLPLERRRDDAPIHDLAGLPGREFSPASTEGSANYAITAFAWPSLRTPVAREPSPTLRPRRPPSRRLRPQRSCDDHSRTWLRRGFPGRGEFSDSTRRPSR